MPDVIKFHQKGLKNIDQQEILFKDIAATTEKALGPSMRFVPNDGDSVLFREYVFGEDNINFEEENVNKPK